MSKAFVIKNKTGEYLAVSGDYEHYWATIDFAHYFRFLNGTHNAKQEAEEFRDGRYPNCEVVEITIAEGDLEEENRLLKRAFENCYSKFQDIAKENNYKTIPSKEHFINQTKKCLEIK